MRKFCMGLALLLLVGCGELPTQPVLDVSPQFGQVDAGQMVVAGQLAGCYELDGSCWTVSVRASQSPTAETGRGQVTMEGPGKGAARSHHQVERIEKGSGTDGLVWVKVNTTDGATFVFSASPDGESRGMTYSVSWQMLSCGNEGCQVSISVWFQASSGHLTIR